MNKYLGEERKRSQNMLIVEGNHEKNKLFWLIFKCFPEININIDEIWIYGTNIYQLYDNIVREYGDQWANENEDIDLPFVISKKQGLDILRYKDDFTNIILIFDYERHDTSFSEEKIYRMQRYFKDATDMGKLYINYPMIESYQHLCKLPDYDYAERKVPVYLQPGKKYKSLVKREECCDEILKISDTNKMDELLHNVLKGVVNDIYLLTAKLVFSLLQNIILIY